MAEEHCKEKYDGKLATKEQLITAFEQGHELCHYGFVSNNDAPSLIMQKENKDCGPKGLSSNAPGHPGNAYCYAKKPLEMASGIQFWKV